MAVPELEAGVVRSRELLVLVKTVWSSASSDILSTIRLVARKDTWVVTAEKRAVDAGSKKTRNKLDCEETTS